MEAKPSTILKIGATRLMRLWLRRRRAWPISQAPLKQLLARGAGIKSWRILVCRSEDVMLQAGKWQEDPEIRIHDFINVKSPGRIIAAVTQDNKYCWRAT